MKEIELLRRKIKLKYQIVTLLMEHEIAPLIAEIRKMETRLNELKKTQG